MRTEIIAYLKATLIEAGTKIDGFSSFYLRETRSDIYRHGKSTAFAYEVSPVVEHIICELNGDELWVYDGTTLCSSVHKIDLTHHGKIKSALRKRIKYLVEKRKTREVGGLEKYVIGKYGLDKIKVPNGI